MTFVIRFFHFSFLLSCVLALLVERNVYMYLYLYTMSNKIHIISIQSYLFNFMRFNVLLLLYCYIKYIITYPLIHSMITHTITLTSCSIVIFIILIQLLLVQFYISVLLCIYIKYFYKLIKQRCQSCNPP
jgi:hypothetical protein